jgi:hypothetical protein
MYGQTQIKFTFYTLDPVQSEWNMWPQIPYIDEMMNVYKILVHKCEQCHVLKSEDIVNTHHRRFNTIMGPMQK